MIEGKIVLAPEMTVAGICLPMTFIADRTPELWRTFMPRRNELTNAQGTDLYSIMVFDAEPNFKQFNPATAFQKWAARPVAQSDLLPQGMQHFVIPAGEYAVFHYTGRAADVADTYRYIFTEWLPANGHETDHRPHIQIMGEKYKNNDPTSEEDLWIPVRKTE